MALRLPKTNYGKSSFQYSGAKIWNNLLNEVRNLNSLATFRIRNHSPLPDPHHGIMEASVCKRPFTIVFMHVYSVILMILPCF